jgi:geranylgeranyl diphosphate synthase type II
MLNVKKESATFPVLDLELRTVLAESAMPERLREAVGYSLFPGGKRIRPRLAMALCEDLGGDPANIAGAAAALEILHAASLIHDDLPSLDNDDMRRGLPSCHKKFGEATALLAGDLMVALAFRSVQRSKCSAEIILRMSELLAEAFIDLCSGQQLDSAAEEERGDLAELHELKTGALFATAMAFGALGAGSSAQQVETAKQLGRGVGLGFQIVDDYLDLFGSIADRGRTDSSDVRNNKHTFFNAADMAVGLKLFTDTQRSVHEMLEAFGAKMRPERGTFIRTKEILESIFSRISV